MKKFFSILLVLIITLLTFVACSGNSIEEQIVTNGKQSLHWFTPAQETITITHTNNSNLIISTSQAQRTYIISNEDENEDLKDFTWTNIQEITSSNILKTISESKEIFIDYINESIVLTDKETLISYINNLPFKSATFPDASFIAAFDPKVDTVFINIESDLLDEHSMVHELFHALANKTRTNNAIWNEYCTSNFDEAFTELLASSVIESNYPTNYDKYIKYVNFFIGCKEIEGIRAYFYGLEQANIPTADFHLYTTAIDSMSNSKTLEDIQAEELTIHLILSKWGLEK